MVSFKCFGNFDLWNETQENHTSRKKLQRDPYACGCAECLHCGGRKVPLRVRRRVLKRAIERGDAQAVAALLHCSTCWPEKCLNRQLDFIESERVARVFVRAFPDYFLNNRTGVWLLIRAVAEGRGDMVRALLEEGVAVDAQTPLTEEKALPLACLKGYVACLEALLEYGADPNERFMEDYTPLHLAVEGGLGAACVEALLRWGAEAEAADQHGTNPLHRAARNADAPCVCALLEAGADPNAPNHDGHTPLHYLARLSYCDNVRYVYRNRRHPSPVNITECVMALVRKGADVNATSLDDESTPLLGAIIYHEDGEMVKALISSGANTLQRLKDGSTLLHRAARGSKVVMEAMIEDSRKSEEFDIDIRDSEGQTPLHYAARNGNKKTVATLVKNGADINARCANQKTPLHYFATSWPVEGLVELLERGADIHTRDALGRTPLHCSAAEDNVLGTEWLLSYGAQATARDAAGRTPLHLTAAAGHWRSSRHLLLLSTSTLVNARDHAGRTALHMAARYGNDKMVRTLLEAGADRAPRDADGERPEDLAFVDSVKLIIRRWALAA